MSDTPNYHAFLHRIAPEMDNVLEKFRTQEARENIAPHWILQTLLLLLIDLKSFYRPLYKIQGLTVTNLTSLPILGGILTGSYSYFQGLNLYLIILLVLCSFIVLTTITFIFYLKRMVNIQHPFFHLPAYKKFRQTEFDLLNHSVIDKNFSYTGLAAFVNGLVTKQKDEALVVTTVTGQYNLEKEQLKKDIAELRAKEEDVIQTYTDIIDDLNEEVEWYEVVIGYLVELLHDLYIILHRIGNGNYGFSDLKLISGFTLYEKQNRKLVLIADESTTGQNPNTVDLDRKRHNPWVQSIVAASERHGNLYHTEPKEGYFVVSYRMSIGYAHSKTWIISLQITPSINEKAFLLALSNDIIDQRVIYNMLHGLCQIINNQQHNKSLKGGGSYGP